MIITQNPYDYKITITELGMELYEESNLNTIHNKNNTSVVFTGRYTASLWYHG